MEHVGYTFKNWTKKNVKNHNQKLDIESQMKKKSVKFTLILNWGSASKLFLTKLLIPIKS